MEGEKVRYAVLSGIRQSVVSPRLLAGAVFLAAAMLLSAMEEIVEAFREAEPLASGFHGGFALNALSTDTLLLCLPILSALPYAGSYVDDLKTGFIKLLLPRTSFSGYILGKAAGCFLSGGLVIALGLWLFYGGACLLFIPLEAPPDPEAPPDASVLEFAAAGWLFFLSGGFWALLGMAASSAMESRYIAYAAPFIFYYVLIILCERYFTSLYVLYPKAWVLPGETWSLGRLGPAVVILELTALTALCFGAAVRKRVRSL